jgi:hypothetical protein
MLFLNELRMGTFVDLSHHYDYGHLEMFRNVELIHCGLGYTGLRSVDHHHNVVGAVTTDTSDH